MSGQKSITDLPDGQLTYGQVFLEHSQGKPPLRAYEVAVETNDGGAYLMVAKHHPSGGMDVWVYDVHASKKHGQLVGDIMEDVPPRMNPYPAVGDPVYEDGPIALKVHSLEAYIETAKQGLALGATGRMADSPLQRAHRSFAGSGLLPARVPPAPPPPTEKEEEALRKKAQEERLQQETGEES